MQTRDHANALAQTIGQLLTATTGKSDLCAIRHPDRYLRFDLVASRGMRDQLLVGNPDPNLPGF